MDNAKGRKKYASDVTHYREKLGRPDLTIEEIHAARLNLEAIARAICEHVWRKKFY